jgi:hypothetical protein
VLDLGVAVLYFLIDALFFALIKPFATWLSKLRIFARVGSWIRSLGPYSTLALFVISLCCSRTGQTGGFTSYCNGKGDRWHPRHRRG